MAATDPREPAPGGGRPPWLGDRGGHLWDKDREVRTVDGARIRYTVLGPTDPNPGVPPVVLCAGFMCPDNFWVGLAPTLARRHRVVVLNYRGVGASTDPRPPGYRGLNLRARDYTVDRLAGDVADVLDAEGVTGAVALGHSMGVEVALQLWRDRPDLVAALSLIAGPYRSPMHTFYGSDIGNALFPFVRVGLPLIPRPVQRQLRKALLLPITLPVAKAIRALGPHTPDEHMRLYREHFARVDPMVALRTAQGMHGFDAGPWLAEVDVPTQVVVGTRDAWTPPSVGEELRDAIPDARLLILEGASHGAPIEFPDRIVAHLDELLVERFGLTPLTSLTPPAQDPPLTAPTSPTARAGR